MEPLFPYRAEFPQSRQESSQQPIICLNHAGISPIPKRTAQKVSQLADYMTRQGFFQYKVLEEAYAEARQRCARLIQVPVEQVAFVRNTSEGLSMVAVGLDWQAGDEIISTDQEFPSNNVVWRDIGRRFAVQVHHVASMENGAVSVNALLERLTDRTRIITLSSVQFGSGAVVDLQRLGEALQDRDTLLVVDAVQSLGLLPMAAESLKVDAVVAGGHKWLLSPEGCGLLYLSDKAMQQVAPRILGWHSVANAGDYNTPCIEPRPGMRRFEAGSPNVLGAVALGESINMLLEFGIEKVQKRVQHLVAAFCHPLQERGFQIHSAREEGGLPAAGMLFFNHPKIDNRHIHRALSQAGIVHVVRQRGIRFAPHFYQDLSDVEHTMAILDPLLSPI